HANPQVHIAVLPNPEDGETGPGTFPLMSELQNPWCPEPSSVPAVVHQLVMNYFACQTCRDHFHHGFVDGFADRKTWSLEGVPDLKANVSEVKTRALGTKLWWWRFHNVVDVRTGLDKVLSHFRAAVVSTGNPPEELLYDGEDLRFPTRRMCP